MLYYSGISWKSGVFSDQDGGSYIFFFYIFVWDTVIFEIRYTTILLWIISQTLFRNALTWMWNSCRYPVSQNKIFVFYTTSWNIRVCILHEIAEHTLPYPLAPPSLSNLSNRRIHLLSGTYHSKLNLATWPQDFSSFKTISHSIWQELATYHVSNGPKNWMQQAYAGPDEQRTVSINRLLLQDLGGALVCFLALSLFTQWKSNESIKGSALPETPSSISILYAT